MSKTFSIEQDIYFVFLKQILCFLFNVFVFLFK